MFIIRLIIIIMYCIYQAPFTQQLMIIGAKLGTRVTLGNKFSKAPFLSTLSTKSFLPKILPKHHSSHGTDASRMYPTCEHLDHLCIFVGNSDTQKGGRYWDPSTGKVNVSRDVSPIDHYYPPRLLTIDIQMGGDVFSTCIRDQISDDKEEVAIDQVEDRLIIPTGATNDTSDWMDEIEPTPIDAGLDTSQLQPFLRDHPHPHHTSSGPLTTGLRRTVRIRTQREDHQQKALPFVSPHHRPQRERKKTETIRYVGCSWPGKRGEPLQRRRSPIQWSAWMDVSLHKGIWFPNSNWYLEPCPAASRSLCHPIQVYLQN